jgi:hypothetical protein
MLVSVRCKLVEQDGDHLPALRWTEESKETENIVARIHSRLIKSGS